MDIPGAKKGIRLRTVVIGINAEMYALHRNAVSKDSGEPMSRHITKYMAAATNPETTMTIVSMRIKDTESISSSTGCSPTYPKPAWSDAPIKPITTIKMSGSTYPPALGITLKK
jgi:hypothetical protein